VFVSGAFRGAPWTEIAPAREGTYHVNTDGSCLGCVLLSAFGQEIELSPFIKRIIAIGEGIEAGLAQAIAAWPKERAADATPGGSDVMMAFAWERRARKADPPPTATGLDINI
jgi:hypothetical protein